jgi:branched-chain amino acid transport system permease protein
MNINVDLLLLQLLNGLALGILYLLIASGLSVIFGMTDIINFAHGALYALGAYVGLTVIGASGSFWIALLLAPIALFVFGAAIERTTLHRIYDRDPLYHIILTFGFVLMITESIEFIWGKLPQFFPTPDLLLGAIQLGPITYPKYKLFLIVTGVVVALALWALFEFTEFGLIIRAGAQDARAVRLMGIDISWYFTLVFAFGAALAGLAGVLAGPFLNVSPSMGSQIIIIAFIVVIVGGMGSLRGSAVAAILIGLVQTLGVVFVPQLTGFLVYILMIGVLVVRPQGLFGEYIVQTEQTKIEFDTHIKPVELTDWRVLAVLTVLVLFPLGGGVLFSSYFVAILALIFIWALLALSLDLVMGYMGLLSFGHAAFWGLGAYATALFALHVSPAFIPALLFAIVVTAIVAWIIGALSIRLTGVYFAMITLAFAQMFYQIALTWDEVTGGANGLSIPSLNLFGIINLGDTTAFYYLTLIVMVSIYGLSVYLLKTPFGRVMTAIRESERRMAFLGYDVNKYKRQAFALSGAIGGISGSLLVTYQMFVSAETLYWIVSGDVVIAMMLGGVGTLFGPMIGAALFIGISEVLSSYVEQWRFALGLLLVLIVLFVPRGLASLYGIFEEQFGLRDTSTTTDSGDEISHERPSSHRGDED